MLYQRAFKIFGALFLFSGTGCVALSQGNYEFRETTEITRDFNDVIESSGLLDFSDMTDFENATGAKKT